jgi:Uri superfamily endonuclease
MTKKIILKGTYCLIIYLRKDTTIEIGKRGSINFRRGYYIYVGSALNSLESRLKRHLSHNKKLFWHVDYLLNSSNAGIEEIVFAVDEGKWECVLAAEVSKEGVEIGCFGCSDCKCNSHLFYFDELEESTAVCINSFKRISLEPNKFDDLKEIKSLENRL